MRQDDLPPQRRLDADRPGPTLEELAAALPASEAGEPMRWSVVPINELPYQHLPFNCGLRDEWAAALGAEHPEADDESWEVRVASQHAGSLSAPRRTSPAARTTASPTGASPPAESC